MFPNMMKILFVWILRSFYQEYAECSSDHIIVNTFHQRFIDPNPWPYLPHGHVYEEPFANPPLQLINPAPYYPAMNVIPFVPNVPALPVLHPDPVRYVVPVQWIFPSGYSTKDADSTPKTTAGSTIAVRKPISSTVVKEDTHESRTDQNIVLGSTTVASVENLQQRSIFKLMKFLSEINRDEVGDKIEPKSTSLTNKAADLKKFNIGKNETKRSTSVTKARNFTISTVEFDILKNQTNITRFNISAVATPEKNDHELKSSALDLESTTTTPASSIVNGAHQTEQSTFVTRTQNFTISTVELDISKNQTDNTRFNISAVETLEKTNDESKSLVLDSESTTTIVDDVTTLASSIVPDVDLTFRINEGQEYDYTTFATTSDRTPEKGKFISETISVPDDETSTVFEARLNSAENETFSGSVIEIRFKRDLTTELITTEYSSESHNKSDIDFNDRQEYIFNVTASKSRIF